MQVLGGRTITRARLHRVLKIQYYTGCDTFEKTRRQAQDIHQLLDDAEILPSTGTWVPPCDAHIWEDDDRPYGLGLLHNPFWAIAALVAHQVEHIHFADVDLRALITLFLRCTYVKGEHTGKATQMLRAKIFSERCPKSSFTLLEVFATIRPSIVPMLCTLPSSYAIVPQSRSRDSMDPQSLKIGTSIDMAKMNYGLHYRFRRCLLTRLLCMGQEETAVFVWSTMSTLQRRQYFDAEKCLFRVAVDMSASGKKGLWRLLMLESEISGISIPHSVNFEICDKKTTSFLGVLARIGDFSVRDMSFSQCTSHMIARANSRILEGGYVTPLFLAIGVPHYPGSMLAVSTIDRNVAELVMCLSGDHLNQWSSQGLPFCMHVAMLNLPLTILALCARVPNVDLTVTPTGNNTFLHEIMNSRCYSQEVKNIAEERWNWQMQHYTPNAALEAGTWLLEFMPLEIVLLCVKMAHELINVAWLTKQLTSLRQTTVVEPPAKRLRTN